MHIIQKRGKHLAYFYKRMGELSSRPRMLRKSKFDNVNTIGFHCINPKSSRDNTCRYPKILLSKKNLSTHIRLLDMSMFSKKRIPF
jgi:hypothetical protein